MLLQKGLKNLEVLFLQDLQFEQTFQSLQIYLKKGGGAEGTIHRGGSGTFENIYISTYPNCMTKSSSPEITPNICLIYILIDRAVSCLLTVK